MIKKQYYNPKDRDQWLVLRNQYRQEGMFGGSDIATILDANPYKGSLELFYNSVGFSPDSTMTNENMIWGTELEDKIAFMYQFYDMDTGDIVENYNNNNRVNQVRRVNAIVTNTDYPWLFSNIDRYLPDIDGIGEFKNMSSFVADASSLPNDIPLFKHCPVGVPPGYYAQVQSYMMIFQKEIGRLVFNLDGHKLVVHEVYRDQDLWDTIAQATEDFGSRVMLGIKIMKEEKDEHKRISLLTELEPPVSDEETYNKFRSQQILQLQQDREDKTFLGTDYQLEMGRKYLEGASIEKEGNKIKTFAGNALKTEFFKHAAEKFDFDGDGTITFKKRISVKVTDGKG